MWVAVHVSGGVSARVSDAPAASPLNDWTTLLSALPALRRKGPAGPGPRFATVTLPRVNAVTTRSGWRSGGGGGGGGGTARIGSGVTVSRR